LFDLNELGLNHRQLRIEPMQNNPPRDPIGLGGRAQTFGNPLGPHENRGHAFDVCWQPKRQNAKLSLYSKTDRPENSIIVLAQNRGRLGRRKQRGDFAHGLFARDRSCVVADATPLRVHVSQRRSDLRAKSPESSKRKRQPSAPESTTTPKAQSSSHLTGTSGADRRRYAAAAQSKRLCGRLVPVPALRESPETAQMDARAENARFFSAYPVDSRRS
jgi:hypothetical protein